MCGRGVGTGGVGGGGGGRRRSGIEIASVGGYNGNVPQFRANDHAQCLEIRFLHGRALVSVRLDLSGIL